MLFLADILYFRDNYIFACYFYEHIVVKQNWISYSSNSKKSRENCTIFLHKVIKNIIAAFVNPVYYITLLKIPEVATFVPSAKPFLKATTSNPG